MIVLNEVAGFVFRKNVSGGFVVEVGGEGIAPTPVLAAKPVDGLGDGSLGGGEVLPVEVKREVGDVYCACAEVLLGETSSSSPVK